MIFNHPAIRNIRINDIRSRKGVKAARTLVLETDLSLPAVGESCDDARLAELLEYLEVAKARAPAFFGRFDNIEIRGAEEAAPEQVPTPLPAFAQTALRKFSPMEALR